MSLNKKPVSESIYQSINRNWLRIMRNPKQLAAILALLAGGTAWMAYPLVLGTVKSMAKPFVGKAGLKVLLEVLLNPKWLAIRRGTVTGAAALAAALASYSVTKNKRLPRGGSWDSFKTLNYLPLKKIGSFYPTVGPNMNSLLNTQATMDLFRADPVLTSYDPYVRNLGTSIIANASNGAKHTSLGSIFDSAVDKILTKMNFLGLARTALNATAAYATASLFTNAVGTMMGLPKLTRDNIISAGTWAGAISSILE